MPQSCTKQHKLVCAHIFQADGPLQHQTAPILHLTSVHIPSTETIAAPQPSYHCRLQNAPPYSTLLRAFCHHTRMLYITGGYIYIPLCCFAIVVQIMLLTAANAMNRIWLRSQLLLTTSSTTLQPSIFLFMAGKLNQFYLPATQPIHWFLRLGQNTLWY